MAMEEIRERAKELCAQMTLQEKAGFLAGEDFWHTKALARLEVEPIRMADGPHGLRKQETGPDGAAIAASTPATCFPTASALACTFDEALARRVGEALGEECREQGVDLLLGPGVNMKRSPLCGRNFEYFSEDPLLAGKLAAAYISGVQSRGVRASSISPPTTRRRPASSPTRWWTSARCARSTCRRSRSPCARRAPGP